ncbi:MAG: GNAT family N-acetyltransferase [Tannerellaceae bacterium]|nr:GNAT family N-acetyltransferase [Tannerellaceae bacterium]
MEKRKIQSCGDKWYEPFREIYTGSFPLHEQRTEEQQQKAFNDPHYFLEITVQNEQVLSFISYWEFPSYIYIEHLAVNPDCRGRQIGSRLLEDFTGAHSKTVLLEIDPLTTDIACKRLVFYDRNGFHKNEYAHFHPPYHREYPPHELIVLSHGRALTPEEYTTFREDLEEIVMNMEK